MTIKIKRTNGGIRVRVLPSIKVGQCCACKTTAALQENKCPSCYVDVMIFNMGDNRRAFEEANGGRWNGRSHAPVKRKVVESTGFSGFHVDGALICSSL